mmetsp:Transcript_17912/g.61826  ORF Transcript_17912/g.61826 Transcript_17912/m.61826 type:complete len:284 (+) Transcript_17912:745-1596(+)
MVEGLSCGLVGPALRHARPVLALADAARDGAKALGHADRQGHGRAACAGAEARRTPMRSSWPSSTRTAWPRGAVRCVPSSPLGFPPGASRRRHSTRYKKTSSQTTPRRGGARCLRSSRRAPRRGLHSAGASGPAPSARRAAMSSRTHTASPSQCCCHTCWSCRSCPSSTRRRGCCRRCRASARWASSATATAPPAGTAATLTKAASAASSPRASSQSSQSSSAREYDRTPPGPTRGIANDAEDFLAIGVFVGWSLALLGVIEDVALSPMMLETIEIVCLKRSN